MRTGDRVPKCGDKARCRIVRTSDKGQVSGWRSASVLTGVAECVSAQDRQ
jgi:hypothetical protein